MDTPLLNCMALAVFGILIKYSIIQASVPWSTKLLRLTLALILGYEMFYGPLVILFVLVSVNLSEQILVPLLLLLVLLNALLFVIGIRSRRNWTIVGAIGMTIASNWSILTLLLTAPEFAVALLVASLAGVIICFGLLVWPFVVRRGRTGESIGQPVVIKAEPKAPRKRDRIREPDFLNGLLPKDKPGK